jgi:hypothetical protein
MRVRDRGVAVLCVLVGCGLVLGLADAGQSKQATSKGTRRWSARTDTVPIWNSVLFHGESGGPGRDWRALEDGRRMLVEVSGQVNDALRLSHLELGDHQTGARLYQVPVLTGEGEFVLRSATAGELAKARISSRCFQGKVVEETFVLKQGQVWPRFTLSAPGQRAKPVFLYIGLDEKAHLGLPGQTVTIHLGEVPCLVRATKSFDSIACGVEVKIRRDGQAIHAAVQPWYGEVAWQEQPVARWRWVNRRERLVRGGGALAGEFYVIRP